MSRFHFFSVAAIAGGLLTIPAVAGEDAETPASVERYELKNRSQFTAPQMSRAPFWPIGHVKINRNAKAPMAPVPTAKLSAEMFSVSSILLGNPSLAVINGRAYGEGEYVRLSKGSGDQAMGTKTAAPAPALRVRVGRITDGAVVLQSSDGQSVVVSLRRNELNAPKANGDEQLLLSEQ